MGLLSALLALVGCDSQRAAQLQPGISSEADVRQQFGTPQAEYAQADGSRTLAYTRQPEGRTNLMIVINPSGTLREIHQVLQPTYFEQIKPGMSEEQVQRILGQPATRQFFKLKQQAVWEWYWLDGQSQMMFSVTFDAEGKVVGSAASEDPRQTLRR